MPTQIFITEINQLTESVRNHINTHRYQVVLLENSDKWNQICSSLDVIGDSLLAIEAYQVAEYPNNGGLKYIYTYGVLQALFILQDAVTHLSEAFEISSQASQVLLDIRNMRNAAIGHPTKQDYKGQRYYNYISRITMTKSGFELLRHSRPSQFDIVRVNLDKAIFDQLNELIGSLRQTVSKLEEFDAMHKEKFQGSPLESIFHSGMGYFFEKISQGIQSQSTGDREFGQMNLRLVRETYENFKIALKERKELNSYTEFDLDEYSHALDKLDSYFDNPNGTMEEADARIYLSYLRNEHKHFVEIAKEIDTDYQSKTK